MNEYTDAARRTALLIAVLTFAGLILRVVLRTPEDGSVLGALSYLSQFFTILTNLLVGLIMLAIGSARLVPHRIITVITAAIIGVGLLYHVLLAHLWQPEGWTLVGDHMVHTVVPVLAFGWWLLFFDKSRTGWADALATPIWPLIYCIYALMRAVFSGFYPYPFLDLATLGWSALLVNIVGLLGAFVVLGAALVSLAKVLPSPR